jgi:CheY-like chemotaxis protein
MRAEASRVHLQGSPLRLKPAAAQALALVVHELGTNAAKYGSLSTEEGCLAVTWAIVLGEEDDVLKLSWEERDGPVIAPPVRRGFGSTVTRSSVERQLRGTLAYAWPSTALVCDLELPMIEIAAGVGLSRSQALPHVSVTDKDTDKVRSDGVVQGLRVLVVEDEAMIAAQIEDALINAGCVVVGPASRVAAAFDLLHYGSIDAALLDVNVAEERSYPIADALIAMAVPFAFCTGYEAGGLPERFKDRPVLNKPFKPTGLIALLSTLAAVRTPDAPRHDSDNG